MACERQSVGLQHSAVEQVVGRFACQRVAAKVNAQQVVTVDDGAARCSEAMRLTCAGRLIVLGMANHSTLGKQDRILTRGDGHAARRCQDVWISAQVVFCEHEVHDRLGIAGAKPISPIVAATTVLALTRLSFQRAGVGLDAKVAPTNADGLARPNGGYGTAAVAVGQIDPVV